ncbi:hypothetical protein [Ferrovibrio sp.]|uniref:hypothetical protein n=1 Tax=Ferrovibrio sp. TaxID=1917215 RepID=UPI0035B41D0B
MTDLLARALTQRSSLSFNTAESEALIRELLQLRALDEVSASNAEKARIIWDISLTGKFLGFSVTMPGPYIPSAVKSDAPSP